MDNPICPMQFKLDRLSTPIGTMLIVIDGRGTLRALDWAGYEERMQRVLRRHFGKRNMVLESGMAPETIRQPLERYLTGELGLSTRFQCRQMGRNSSSSSGMSCDASPPEQRRPMPRLRGGSGGPRRCALWAPPTARIPSAS